MKRSIGPVIVILVAILGSLTLLKRLGGPAPHSGETVGIGEKVDLRLHRFGAPPSESAGSRLQDLGAKIVVLNFWASWCEACLVEMPSLVKLRHAFQGQGLEVVPLNVDDNPEAVIPRMAEVLKIDFPIFVDRDQELSRKFDVHGIPFTAILRSNGEILLMEAGERDWFSKDVQEKVKSWLNSPSS